MSSLMANDSTEHEDFRVSSGGLDAGVDELQKEQGDERKKCLDANNDDDVSTDIDNYIENMHLEDGVNDAEEEENQQQKEVTNEECDADDLSESGEGTHDGGSSAALTATTSSSVATVGTTKKSDPIMKELTQRLKCSKFPHTCPSPLRMCSNGHLICSSCLLGILKSRQPRCPECDVDLLKAGVFANLALEKIAAQCIVACRYKHCQTKLMHSNLESHLQYCVLPIKEKDLVKDENISWKATNMEPAGAVDRATALVASEIECNFCGSAAPPPILQCRNGHISCSFCLSRMLRADWPTCPFCQTDISVIGRNLHLEELAASQTVKCRFERCEKEMKYPQLAEHQSTCECQPIRCVTCNAKTEQDACYVSWDLLWQHYKQEHLNSATPTYLNGMTLTEDHVKRMIKGKLGFICWGHVKRSDGQPLRVFPGMYFSKQRNTFYFTVRVMFPLAVAEKEDERGTFKLIVTSPTSPIKMTAQIPAISYRIPHTNTANSPCLAISVATMESMIRGGQVKFEITLPEGGPDYT